MEITLNASYTIEQIAGLPEYQNFLVQVMILFRGVQWFLGSGFHRCNRGAPFEYICS